MVVDVDGGVGHPSGVDSGLWMPFSQPRGDGKEGQQQREWRSTAPPVATVVARWLRADGSLNLPGVFIALSFGGGSATRRDPAAANAPT